MLWGLMMEHPESETLNAIVAGDVPASFDVSLPWLRCDTHMGSFRQALRMVRFYGEIISVVHRQGHWGDYNALRNCI